MVVLLVAYELQEWSKGEFRLSSCTLLDFLKVLRFPFPVQVVGPQKHEKSSRSRFVLVKKFELDLSGALNDGFLLNALEALFRLSKVLLDL